jgi:hypothetical protein
MHEPPDGATPRHWAFPAVMIPEEVITQGKKMLAA